MMKLQKSSARLKITILATRREWEGTRSCVHLSKKIEMASACEEFQKSSATAVPSRSSKNGGKKKVTWYQTVVCVGGAFESKETFK